ncbi:putative RNA recognition motif domain, nucleotide-binding alpha-beta plait domain superfamily [Helianthus anomalus]
MSSNLWVGNLAAGVTDSDLKNMFEKFGGVSVETCSLLRNYAFVYLKNVDDARRVKESLNGVVLRGYPLKIDFAKPVGVILLGLRCYEFIIVRFGYGDLYYCFYCFSEPKKL